MSKDESIVPGSLAWQRNWWSRRRGGGARRSAERGAKLVQEI